jgi:hypothetical protein
LSKEVSQTNDEPPSRHQEAPTRKDSRNLSMLGRTIKTTGITVLRAEPAKGEDWWVCKCPCGGEFVAHGWGVRHGHTRNCGSDEHKVQERENHVAPLVLLQDSNITNRIIHDSSSPWPVHCNTSTARRP